MPTKSSYSQILKASAIIGGASGINQLLGMVRVKFAAVLIGATGVGLIASFGTLQVFIGTLAGLGLQSSAVREIAAAVGKNDDQAIGRAVLTLRRLCWLTGLVGMAAMMLLAPWLSQLTFGHRNYTLDIAALGIIIFFGNLSGGQMALIQGTRRIGEMARANTIAAGCSTVATISLYCSLGLRGIVPALIGVSAIQLALSGFFARRVSVPQVRLTWRQTFAEAGSMLKLGLIMMLSGLTASAVSYLTVTLITEYEGSQAVGLYSAAFALSGIFVNFVLRAMGADYYPRLTARMSDKPAMVHMVNEQTEICLLLAVPGLLATMALAPLILQIFYTREFLGAVGMLQWFILGCLGRVIAWPMGYVVLSMNRGGLFFLLEFSLMLLQILLIKFGLPIFGLDSVAISFAAIAFLNIIIEYIVVMRLINFKWHKSSLRVSLISIAVTVALLVVNKVTSNTISTPVGLIFAAMITCLNAVGLFYRINKSDRLSTAISKMPLVRKILQPQIIPE